jgi:hypothetical protein
MDEVKSVDDIDAKLQNAFVNRDLFQTTVCRRFPQFALLFHAYGWVYEDRIFLGSSWKSVDENTQFHPHSSTKTLFLRVV